MTSPAPFNISPTAYLTSNPRLAGIIVSAIVLYQSSSSAAPRTLVIQRAATDGFPLRWEPPGGGVDLSDATILDALRRELHEETGLAAAWVALVDDTVEFVGRHPDGAAGVWKKITFLVEAEHGNTEGGGGLPPVKLNPEEHVDYVWAGEEEVTRRNCEGKTLDFAYAETKGLYLRAFAAWGSDRAQGEGRIRPIPPTERCRQ